MRSFFLNLLQKFKNHLSSANGKGQDDAKNLHKIIIGLCFIIFSLILPRLVQQHIFILLKDLEQSIITRDGGLLLLTANKLVFFNTLRHSPVIVGAFILGEGLSSKFNVDRLVFFCSLIIIPILYRLISLIYDIQFIFTGSGYFTVLVILILYFLTFKIRPIVIKLIIISLFLFGFDWLEIVPLLSKYGFGGGEIANSIRVVSGFIGADYVMNYVGLTISSMLIISALILTKVVVDHYNKMFLVEKLRNIEIEALRSRYFQEIKHLVHDLKTPLVTIQGLNGVINMTVDEPKIKDYTEKISDSVEKIASMISEILHENKLSVIDIKEVTDFLKVHLSLEELQARVKIELLTNKKIYANKYLLSRALINIIDNGLKAIDSSDGFVYVRICEENDGVDVIIEDNGKGIPKESLDRIWELGYTKGRSTGLGLNFAQKVINDHGGDIKIESKVGVGTTVKIKLPGVEANEEESLSNR